MKLAELISRAGEQEAVIQVLCYLLSIDRTTIFLMREVNDDVAKEALQFIDKYKKGTPLAYLLGYCYFYNRKFFVNKDVLIPRFDTEVLVELAEKKIIADSVVYKEHNPYKILDLCCGSGAIGISLACLCDWLTKKNDQDKYEVTLADVSRNALLVSQVNAKAHDVDVNFVHSDLLNDINGSFDLIVCNPPYIRTREIGLEDKRILKEPKLALDGGLDGLYYYRRILSTVKKNLYRGATLMFEVGFDQAADVKEIAENNGFRNVKIYKDLANHDRVVTMRMWCLLS